MANTRKLLETHILKTSAAEVGWRRSLELLAQMVNERATINLEQVRSLEIILSGFSRYSTSGPLIPNQGPSAIPAADLIGIAAWLNSCSE